MTCLNGMKLYNTLTKQKEEFVPLHEGKVSMYVCGPTVYNFIHIGNARPMIVFDTVRRYMEYKGYEVNYVSNFTDVDDKIIKKAIEEGVQPRRYPKRYIAECKKDMARHECKTGNYTSAGYAGDPGHDRYDQYTDRERICLCGSGRNRILPYQKVQRLRKAFPQEPG